jgi:metal-responsive CopG/Arc/MetJ family transcriptional regulator
MATVSVEIPDTVLRDFQDFAARSQREPADVIREALEFYQQQRIHPDRTNRVSHSVLDHKPISLGKILKPWSSRSELLEDFFDRD